MAGNEHSHLNDLSKLRFLVVDEADRMISQGNFPELNKIFEAIRKNVNQRFRSVPHGGAGRMSCAMDYADDEYAIENDEGHAMLGGPGVAKVTMLEDILRAKEGIAVGDADPVAIEGESGDEGGSSAGNGHSGSSHGSEDDEEDPPIHR